MSGTESGRSLSAFVLHAVHSLGADLRARDAPITTVLAILLLVVFLEQAAAALLAGVSIEAIASHLFLEYTTWAWLLSFFLHRNLVHFATNVALIWLLGRVLEASFPRWAYVAFVGLTAVASTLGGLLFTASFTSDPVAVYGASGLGFALATYALSIPLATADSVRAAYRLEHLFGALTPAEELAFLIGLSAVLTVLIDLLTGPFWTVYWANGGHTAGAAVGCLAGAIRAR